LLEAADFPKERPSPTGVDPIAIPLLENLNA
jgi:hypothetical protein